MSKKSSKVRFEYITICDESKCKFDFVFYEDDSLKVNRKLSDLQFVEAEDGYSYIQMGNKKLPAEIVEKNQNKYHILINGNSYYFSVETPISFKRRKFLSKVKKSSKVSLLTAPMPGKIVDILVAEGDTVSNGDSVLILEAMKMQNEIHSEIDGVIKKIHVKAEQNVMKDEVMIEIEKK